jgi:hypothetical protein
MEMDQVIQQCMLAVIGLIYLCLITKTQILDMLRQFLYQVRSYYVVVVNFHFNGRLLFSKGETHGGDDVAVYASGPHSHLFVGNYEQNNIPYLISFAAKIGEYNETPDAVCHDDTDPTDPGGAVTFKLSMIWLFLAYLLHSVIRFV